MERRERVLTLRVADIRPNPHQPRQTFDDAGLRELASSIRRHGILQPLTVRSAGGGTWELVAGERRLRAAKLAGLEKVPCIRREADDRESALLALVENLQRRDLHYLEEAAAIAAYIRQTGITQEEAAAQLGRSPSALANKLRLLRLSPACRELLVRNALTERHARCLLRLEDEEERLAALRHIVYGDPKRLYSFRLGPEPLRRLGDAAEAFAAAQLERGFKTLDFYKSLQPVEIP